MEIYIFREYMKNKMIKAKLLVDGHVQGVGYRSYVMLVARKMKITGIIKNLLDGKVEIICECKDYEQLNKFMKNIMLSSSEKNFLSPNVTSIQKVGEESIEKPEHGIFDIDYGKIDYAQKEIITKLDTILIKNMEI